MRLHQKITVWVKLMSITDCSEEDFGSKDEQLKAGLSRVRERKQAALSKALQSHCFEQWGSFTLPINSYNNWRRKTRRAWTDCEQPNAFMSSHLRPWPIWGWRWPHCPAWCCTGIEQLLHSLPPCPRWPWPRTGKRWQCRRCLAPVRWYCMSAGSQVSVMVRIQIVCLACVEFVEGDQLLLGHVWCDGLDVNWTRYEGWNIVMFGKATDSSCSARLGIRPSGFPHPASGAHLTYATPPFWTILNPVWKTSV